MKDKWLLPKPSLWWPLWWETGGACLTCLAPLWRNHQIFVFAPFYFVFCVGSLKVRLVSKLQTELIEMWTEQYNKIGSAPAQPYHPIPPASSICFALLQTHCGEAATHAVSLGYRWKFSTGGGGALMRGWLSHHPSPPVQRVVVSVVNS